MHECNEDINSKTNFHKITFEKFTLFKTSSHVNNLLVEEILEFLSRERKVKTSYVRCSLNEVADTLAALSRGQPIGEISFVEPPLQLILQLIKEQQYVSPLIQHPSILNWEMHGVRTSCAIQRKDPGG
ncbi:hypothetical protein V6N13_006110 [Hibiscus sabdariffa]